MKQFLNSQPEWIRTTRKLSPDSTLKFRDELKKAQDPNDFVLKQIPNIFKKNGHLDLKSFKKSLLEINDLYPNQIKKFKEYILEKFKLEDTDKDYLEINQRAKQIKDKTGDFELNSIILRLIKLGKSISSYEELIGVIAKKPIKVSILSLSESAMLYGFFGMTLSIPIGK